MSSLISSLDDLQIDDKAPAVNLTLTGSELEAIKEVRDQLLKSGIHEASIDPRMLTLTTINQKLRVEDAVKKYKKFVEALAIFDISDFEADVWRGLEDFDSTICPLLESYSVCRTHNKRSVFWINGGTPVTLDKERDAVRAGIMYFAAIHADEHSLREGISFVIDVGNQTSTRVGNEKKMQSMWQSFPLRPQRILISGASLVKRIFINGLVRFAALFSKAKVLDRIRFVTMEEVIKELSPEVVPRYASDKGIKEDIGSW
eukprot:CAMPEP_0118639974 /NCGR_PEP_ID=MMETSP0785-20121206/4509_1 /TAXON_ID=91992 /ORGANISM="Bolidomonas pacifica, Strain CCMP 1866" /LENGTH=258 /DNA_ID=CAMNT_0006531337 /DNA_START=84 /DNA_END=857 /DNA_ORIENTATION=+